MLQRIGRNAIEANKDCGKAREVRDREERIGICSQDEILFIEISDSDCEDLSARRSSGTKSSEVGFGEWSFPGKGFGTDAPGSSSATFALKGLGETRRGIGDIVEGRHFRKIAERWSWRVISTETISLTQRSVKWAPHERDRREFQPAREDGARGSSPPS